PVGLGVFGALFDHAAERRIGWWKLIAGNRNGRAWRARGTVDLLRVRHRPCECQQRTARQQLTCARAYKISAAKSHVGLLTDDWESSDYGRRLCSVKIAL